MLSTLVYACTNALWYGLTLADSDLRRDPAGVIAPAWSTGTSGPAGTAGTIASSARRPATSVIAKLVARLPAELLFLGVRGAVRADPPTDPSHCPAAALATPNGVTGERGTGGTPGVGRPAQPPVCPMSRISPTESSSVIGSLRSISKVWAPLRAPGGAEAGLLALARPE